MKTFHKFRQDIHEAAKKANQAKPEPTEANCVHPGDHYTDKHGTTHGLCHVCGEHANTKTGNGLTFCGDCGKPTCFDHRNVGDPADRCTKCKPKVNEDEEKPRLFPHEECPHCGEVRPEGELHHCWQSGHHNEPEVKEDEGGAPTNNVGSGQIAGAGVGPQGEPGVSPNYQRKRNQLKLMNGPAVDPRMFADKVYRRKPLS